jgi:predicted nucleic acid-binding protein
LSLLFRTAEIIDTPPEDESVGSEMSIADLGDRPILRAAIRADVNILITGDRHFLESGLMHPRILKPAEFLSINF